jgi:hypothetical protein
MQPCLYGLPAFNADGEIVMLPCGSWACPRCGVVNALHWAERVRYGIALWRPQPAYFWTLTLPAWVQDSATGYRLLPKRFDSLRKSITRHVGAWYYVAFVEEHPHRAFIPHFHIISLQKSPSRLKDVANHAGFGYMAQEVVINGPKAAWYVSKYTSKQGYEMPRNFRRVRVCQAWPALPAPLPEVEIYPMRSNETIDGYCARVSVLLGLDFTVCKLQYTQAALAARAKRMDFQAEVRQ